MAVSQKFPVLLSKNANTAKTLAVDFMSPVPMNRPGVLSRFPFQSKLIRGCFPPIVP